MLYLLGYLTSCKHHMTVPAVTDGKNSTCSAIVDSSNAYFTTAIVFGRRLKAWGSRHGAQGIGLKAWDATVTLRELTRLCSSSTKLNMAEAKRKVGAMLPTASQADFRDSIATVLQQ